MPTQVKIVWKDAAFLAGLMNHIERKMLTLESETVTYYREATSTPDPPASMPGGFPHRRRGLLQKSLRANVNRVGQYRIQLTLTNTARSPAGFAYPAALETGTSRMRPRPHMRPTGAFMWKRAQRLFSARPRGRVF